MWFQKVFNKDKDKNNTPQQASQQSPVQMQEESKQEEMTNPFWQAEQKKAQSAPKKNFFSQLSSSAKKSGNKFKKMVAEAQKSLYSNADEDSSDNEQLQIKQSQSRRKSMQEREERKQQKKDIPLHNPFVQKLGADSTGNLQLQSQSSLPQSLKLPDDETTLRTGKASMLDQSAARSKGSYQQQKSAPTTIMKQHEMQGFVIDEPAQEREVFVQCPMCQLDVFDSGLSNQLKCLKCTYEFSTEKKHRKQEEDSGGGMPNTSLSPVRKQDSQDQSFFNCMQQPNRLGQHTQDPFSKKDSIQFKGAPEALGAQKQKEDSKQEQAQIIPQPKEEQKENQMASFFRNIVSSLEKQNLFKQTTDKQSNSQPKEKTKTTESKSTQKIAELDSVLLFVIKETVLPDFLLEPRAPIVIKASDQNETLMCGECQDVYQGTCQTCEEPTIIQKEKTSEEKKQQEELNEISAFAPEVEEDDQDFEQTLPEESKSEQQQELQEAQPVIPERDVDYHMILSSLLMPFFQLRTRILERGSYFKIGEIEFYVAATTKTSQGKVTGSTVVRCSASVSREETLQRVNLVPLQAINSSRSSLMQNILKPYFTSHIGMCLHKDQVLQIGRSQRFLVRYARPYFGVINQGTEVKIDQQAPRKLQRIRIAPIWDTQEQYTQASRDGREVTTKMLKEHILVPFYQKSGLTCFIEKGETLRVASREFFVNDCWPRQGIVDRSTTIEVELGFTREVFQRKQVQADERLAERLQHQTPPETQQQFRYGFDSEEELPQGVRSVYYQYEAQSSSDEEEDVYNFPGLPEGLQARLRASLTNMDQDSTVRELLCILSEVEDLRTTRQQEATEIEAQPQSEEQKSNPEAITQPPSEDEATDSDGQQPQEASQSQSAAATAQQMQSEEEINNTIQEVLRQVLNRQHSSQQQQYSETYPSRVRRHQHRHHVQDELHSIFSSGSNSNSKATPKAILDTLPSRFITETELTRQTAAEVVDEGNIKCLVCLVDYEVNDEVRTMPCLHFFHKACIDKWLLKRAATCPICKFNIKQDYNAQSSDQLTSEHAEGQFQDYDPLDFNF